MNQDKIRQIIEQYNNTGRGAWYHPKKHTISINGGRAIPEDQAVKIMLEVINKKTA